MFYEYIRRDAQAVHDLSLQRWIQDRGDETLRVSYPIGPDMLVFDVGGYRGEWSARVAQMYDPQIYIFEPVPDHVDALRKRFDSNPKVAVFPFGLADRDERRPISREETSSSFVRKGAGSLEADIRDIVRFIEEKEIGRINLLKINIEGLEYALLEHMLRSGAVRSCVDIQVQFHPFLPDALERRADIRRGLRATHRATYNYPFVWENWRLRRAPRAGASVKMHRGKS